VGRGRDDGHKYIKQGRKKKGMKKAKWEVLVVKVIVVLGNLLLSAHH